jgi:hypothetical protein
MYISCLLSISTFDVSDCNLFSSLNEHNKGFRFTALYYITFSSIRQTESSVSQYRKGAVSNAHTPIIATNYREQYSAIGCVGIVRVRGLHGRHDVVQIVEFGDRHAAVDWLKNGSFIVHVHYVNTEEGERPCYFA